MKLSGFILAFLLAVSVRQTPVLADMPEPEPKPQSQSYEAGRKAVEAKDFKSALAHLAKAAQEIPNDADVHNLLGYSYRNLKQFDKAMEHYRTALKLDPNHRSAHEYMGELYLDIGQPADAEKQLQSLKGACPWFGKCAEYEDLKEAIAKYRAKK